jgi:hypothetical protein
MKSWEKLIWSVAAGVVAVFAVMLFWMFWQAFSNLQGQLAGKGGDASEHFLIAGTGVLAGLLFKVLSMFVGSVLSLAGLALSFHNLRTSSTFGDDASKVKFSTNSPGIFAMAAGTLIVVVATKHEVRSDYENTSAGDQRVVLLGTGGAAAPTTPAALPPATAASPGMANNHEVKQVQPTPTEKKAAPVGISQSPCQQAVSAYEKVLSSSESGDVCGARKATVAFVESANVAAATLGCNVFLNAAPANVNKLLAAVEKPGHECGGVGPMKVGLEGRAGGRGQASFTAKGAPQPGAGVVR